MKKMKKKILTGLLAVLGGVIFSLGVACGEKTVEYTFSTAGGNAISNVTVTEGSTYELPEATREGYRFMGWYASEDYEGERIVSVTALENATYYAKWEKLYTVTLNADGGQLANNVTSVELIAGENVYDAVRDLTPAKGDLQFGAWFNGSAELAKSLVMPKQDLTLKAKYKATYTIQFRNDQNEKIVIDDEEIQDVVEYAYVGTTIDPEYSIKGHTEYDRTPLEPLTVSETAEDNVIVLKYEPNDITVNFYPNYPDGTLGDGEVCELKYGETVELISDYTTDGYCFIGWATEKGGEVKYAVDTVTKNIYGFDGEVTPVTFKPEETLNLFGVWKQGYSDAFSGEDYLYIFDETSGEIYLFRAGKYFKGTLYNENKNFRFNDEGKRLIGQLYDDHTFLYSVSDREGTYYTLFVSPLVGLNENVTIRFDSYDKITYSEKTDAGIIDSIGRYEYVASSSIKAKFTEGPLSGQTLTMNLGYVGGVPAFQIRNEAEWMKLNRFVIINGQLNQYNDQYYCLQLNGLGTATMVTSGSQTAYVYEVQGDTIILYNRSNKIVEGYARIMQIYNPNTDSYVKGYMLYNEALDATFELSDGSTLTTDGLYNFTYTTATKEYTGYFSMEQSFLGGMLMTATDFAETQEEETVSFLFHFTQTVEGEETITNVTLKSNDYGEFLFKAEEGIYYAPLIVVGEEEGKATVYGITAKGEFAKKLYGSYTYDEKTGLYTFIADLAETTDTEVLTVAGIDLSKVGGFTFTMDKSSYMTKIHYWYSYENTELGETQLLNTVYTSEDGEETLTLVAGFAIYNKGTTTKIGAYAYSDDYLEVTFNGEKNYFELTDGNDDKTFAKLLYLPYNIYRVKEDGSQDKTEYFAYDGKGGVKYVNATGEYVGTIAEVELPDGVSILGNPTVYTFTATDATLVEPLTVTYVLSSDGKKFYVENSEYRGRYVSDDGVLELDGFGLNAKYTNADNEEYISTYSIKNTEDFIKISIYAGGTRYVNLDVENKTFIIYGSEAGVYSVYRNSLLTNTKVELDGLGGFTTYVEVEGEEGVEKKDVKLGTYVVESDEVILTFENGDEWRGIPSLAIVDSKIAYIFTIVDQTLVQTYINENDWSVLILDGKGGAIKYNTNGVKDTGSYVMISEDLLYFVNKSKNDAYVYRFDSATGTVTAPEHDSAIGYYTSDFESLIFTIYGYAVFNGEVQYYYYEEDNGDVYIYRLLEDGEDKDALIAEGAEITKYNFVKTKFGTFSDLSTTWNEEVYFKNEGYDIEFVRTGTAQNFAEEYPIPLSEDESANLKSLWFAPTGEAEFRVEGLVYLSNNDTLDCTVTRIFVDGVLEMYVMVGNYRFDILVTYDYDEDAQALISTYEIVRMRYFVDAYSYAYLQAFYEAYTSSGTELANTYGGMSIYYEFSKTGEKGEMYADGEYLEDSGLKDLNGKLLSFERAVVTQVNDLMMVTIEGSDGYNYRIYFGLMQHPNFKVPGYVIVALVRMQDFTVTVGADEYSLSVGRLIKSELAELVANVGKVYEINLLKKNGEAYEGIANENMDVELMPVDDVTAYLALRVKAQAGGYESYVYYILRFTDTIDGAVTEEKVIPTYATASLEIYEATRISTSAGSEFIEVIQVGDEQKIVYMFYGVDKYVIAECEGDGNVFVVTTATGETFTVTVEDGVLKSVEISSQE